MLLTSSPALPSSNFACPSSALLSVSDFVVLSTCYFFVFEQTGRNKLSYHKHDWINGVSVYKTRGVMTWTKIHHFSVWNRNILLLCEFVLYLEMFSFLLSQKVQKMQSDIFVHTFNASQGLGHSSSPNTWQMKEKNRIL